MRLLNILLLLTLSACSTVSVQLQEQPQKYNYVQPSKQYTAYFFVFGIAQTRNVDAVELCGGADKIVKVNSFYRPLDYIIMTVTFNLVMPKTIRIYCVPSEEV